MEQRSGSGAQTAIEELRVDSKIGKGKHFNASDRKLFWHRICGVPVILANLFVGIVLVSLQAPLNEDAALHPPLPIVSESRPKLGGSEDEQLRRGNMGLRNTEAIESRWALLSIFLAFSAASLSAVQTFFNFHKSSEGHRAIGNRYLHVSRQCKSLQQKHRDIPFAANDFWTQYEKLYAEYHQINTEAEAFPTSSRDLSKAKIAIEISPYKAPSMN